ncbi:hypothetical protein [Streptomyces zingiberis]|uniref:hypothetical protein n=1 Tax=Streptomyces zingiberis TaxID=2053010 RepID=UPI002892CBBD|nr:hypothetical protein [Streptomyces zingiberis]
MRPDPGEVEAGLAQLEGYLRGRSHIADAHAEAEAFADRLPWLTTAQRAEVVGCYVQDRLALTRRLLEHVVGRAGELREEYGARYELLRRRLVCASVAVLLSAVALSVWALAVAGLVR